MSTFALPKLRNHTPSGRAVVTVRLKGGGRRDIYCGQYKSTEAAAEYKRVCAVLLAHDGVYPGGECDLTVSEAILSYVRHATSYYGESTKGLAYVLRPLKTVRELFGTTVVAEFGPQPGR